MRSTEWCNNISEGKREVKLDKATVENLYWIQELTLADIGFLYGTNDNSVWSFMKRYNIPRRTRLESFNLTNKYREIPRKVITHKKKKPLGRPPILNRDFTSQDIQHYYWELGLPMCKFAKVLQTSGSIISQKMNEWDMPRRSNREEQLGERNGFYGKHHTEERNKLVSSNTERSRKIGIAHKGISKPGKENAIKGAAKISKHQKENWQNPEYSKKVLSKLCSHPNKPESLLLNLINIACPNQYKFTGDGTVTIANLHPDFTNCNSQKKVIEMFGDYFHEGENPQDKINRYAGFGFSCLVIWEHELKEKTEEELIRIIKDFNNKNDDCFIEENPQQAEGSPV